MIRKSNRERGMALILVLFALMLLTAVGLAMMYMTTTETGIDANFRSEVQAYYASKAGLEEGRERLRKYTSPATAITPPTVMPSTTNAGGVIYIINPASASESITPWVAGSTYFDDELCHENYSGLGLSATAVTVPCTTAPTGTWYTVANPQSTDPYTATASAIPYKWVRITLKQVGSTAPYCANSSTPQSTCPNASRQVCAALNGASPAVPLYYETPMPAGTTTCEQSNMREVYVITSLSKLSNGSRKMTQYEVSPISLPPLPAAITMDGASPNFSPPHSNALVINGADACGVTGTMPAMGGYDATSTSTLITDIPSNKTGLYQGAGGTPSVVNVNSTLGMLSTVGGLQNLVTNIDTSADQIYNTNNPTISNLGTTSAPLITVVNGDYTLNPTSGGAGLLLVTGTLTIGGSGNSTFNGIVLVIGKGQLTSNGNGSSTLNGGLFVANLYNSSNQLLPSTSAPGIPSFTWNGAGNMTLNYDSCWMTNFSQRIALRVMSSHEEVY